MRPKSRKRPKSRSRQKSRRRPKSRRRSKSRRRPKSRRRQNQERDQNQEGDKKNTQLLGTEENKSCNLLGQKKSLNLSVPKNHATSQDKKKSHNLLVQQKITRPLGEKNVLKIPILVTIKLQEIGTGHLGLVFL